MASEDGSVEQREHPRYDVTTWENRNRLDHVAVWSYRLLEDRWKDVVVVYALVLLLAQFALAAVVVEENPLLLSFFVLSVVPAVVLVWFVRRIDPERKPLRPMAVTFALGSLFTGVAATLDTGAGAFIQPIPVVGAALFFVFFVAPIEEVVKWAAVRLYVYDTDDFDLVVDGAVYGAAAGLGFATVENTIYILDAAFSAGQANTPVLEEAFGTSLLRSLAGPGHVVYTAFAGYYLGLAKFNPENYGPIVLKGLLIAILIHASYDTLTTYLPALFSFDSPIAVLGFVVGYIGIFTVLLFRKLARHRHEAGD